MEIFWAISMARSVAFRPAESPSKARRMLGEKREMDLRWCSVMAVPAVATVFLTAAW